MSHSQTQLLGFQTTNKEEDKEEDGGFIAYFHKQSGGCQPRPMYATSSSSDHLDGLKSPTSNLNKTSFGHFACVGPWIFYQNWIPHFQFGRVAMFFQWKRVFPVYRNTLINIYKTVVDFSSPGLLIFQKNNL